MHGCNNNRTLPLPRELDSNVVQKGAATVLEAPVACELKYTLVVVAEHQRGTVVRLTAEPHARLSAAPAARHAASEPM